MSALALAGDFRVPRNEMFFGQVDERFDRKERHRQCGEEAAAGRGNASVGSAPAYPFTSALLPGI
jgi:hypothetical protein